MSKDEMAALTAYMAFTSRGKPFDIKIPDDPRALAAYENGKRYFYTRRGQLNFSCASCHVQNPGERIRAEVLAPALGILNAMPIYRSEWGGMGTTSRRFITCNSQIRGVPLEPQADEYRDLEYFLSYVSNGLPISGPGRGHDGIESPLQMICWLASVCCWHQRPQHLPQVPRPISDRPMRGRRRQQGSRPPCATSGLATATALDGGEESRRQRRFRPGDRGLPRKPKRWPRPRYSRQQRERGLEKPRNDPLDVPCTRSAETSHDHPPPGFS